jgi:guanylate kinase
MSKLLLLLGPSGVGKSTIIDELLRLNDKFIYISPFTTRPLRMGERNKISITNEEMDKMWWQGKFLIINKLYNIRYATPKLPIVQALANNAFPILDWPANHINILSQIFPKQLYKVYILPPSIKVLRQRLSKDGRDPNGYRLRSARQELKKYSVSKHSGTYDLEIISKEGQVPRIAQEIYTQYLKVLNR